MAKKKGLAGAHQRAKKTRKIVKSAAPVSNPPLFTDLVEFIVPGFVGFAATRFTARVVRGMAEKRFPRLGKHIAVLSSLAAFGASWLLVHRVKKVAQYHTPVTVGAAIAALQTVVQTYVPKYGWIVSDYQEPKALPAPITNTASPSTTQQIASGGFPSFSGFNLQPSVAEQMAAIEDELAEIEPMPAGVPGMQGMDDDEADGIGDILDELGDFGSLAGGFN